MELFINDVLFIMIYINCILERILHYDIYRYHIAPCPHYLSD